MEKIKIFSIYDTKQQTYSNPLIDTLHGIETYLRYLINEANTIDYQYSTDFIVYDLGSFNVLNGNIDLLKEKLVVNNLSFYGVKENA